MIENMSLKQIASLCLSTPIWSILRNMFVCSFMSLNIGGNDCGSATVADISDLNEEGNRY